MGRSERSFMKKWLFKDTQGENTHIEEGETAEQAALNVFLKNGVTVTEVKEEKNAEKTTG